MACAPSDCGSRGNVAWTCATGFFGGLAVGGVGVFAVYWFVLRKQETGAPSSYGQLDDGLDGAEGSYKPPAAEQPAAAAADDESML